MFSCSPFSSFYNNKFYNTTKLLTPLLPPSPFTTLLPPPPIRNMAVTIQPYTPPSTLLSPPPLPTTIIILYQALLPHFPLRRHVGKTSQTLELMYDLLDYLWDEK